MERCSAFPVRLLNGPRALVSAVRSGSLALFVVVALAVLVSAQGTPVPGGPLTDAQLFDDTVLQRIELQVNSRDWDTLRANFKLNTYYPATVLWRGEIVRNVGIRSRGSGTRSGQKPGLLVDFNRYVTGQHFLGLKAVVLDNHLQDPSAMREALTMSVHAKLGLPAPREALAELYVNRAFLGVYTIVENIDSVAVKRLFAPRPASTSMTASMQAAGADLPIRVPPRAPTRPVPLPPVPPAPAPPADVPTGYLYEYHWLDNFWATYPGSDLALYPPMLEAKTHETESLDALYRPIETLFREINEAPDSAFVARVGPLFDLDLFVKQAAVEAYMADWDGVVGAFGLNNFYLYRAADGGAYRIVPWDEDNTFGGVDYPVDVYHDKHVLMRRAMQVPELRQLFVETLRRVAEVTEARDSADGATWLEREINRRLDLMAERMRADLAKPFSDDEVASAVAFNLTFARERGDDVRNQILGTAQAQARGGR
jgi:hypothetical protein